MNDDATAQMLLKPIPPELFDSLYQQGWRVDQLFRLLVDRIEFKDPSHRELGHHTKPRPRMDNPIRLYTISTSQRTCLRTAKARLLIASSLQGF